MTNTQSEALTAYRRASTPETTVSFRGSEMSFLAKGEDTGGRFALMEFQSRRGAEPPPHVHDWEHEMLYVIDGALELYCEDKILVVYAGEVAFIPQGKAHAFCIRSPRLRALAMIQAVGEHAVGLDRLVLEMSDPVKSLDFTPDKAASLAGVHYLSPEEIAGRMPRYPSRRISHSEH